MTFKIGGTPWNKGKHHTLAARKNMSIAQKGKKVSDETRTKMMVARWFKTASKETREKMSRARKGCTWSAETLRKRSKALWKGGPLVSDKRSKARRKCFGYDMINEPFDGCEGHHIDKEHVIFIPKELHRSVWHSQDKPETMDQINAKVFCWLLGR